MAWQRSSEAFRRIIYQHHQDLIGIVSAILVTLLVSAVFPSLRCKVPGWAVATAFSVSVAVGLFFGVWPAVTASRLDPVEALRYE